MNWTRTHTKAKIGTPNPKGEPMQTKEAPKCPSCGSSQVLFRISKGFICRRCGHEWNKPK